jgi:hypothetical protein
VEEVGGQQLCCWCAQEGAPLGVCPSGRWAATAGCDDAADCVGSDVVSESGELSLDAAVSPPEVLLCQADDQFAELVFDGWSSRRVRVSLFLCDEAAVPGQERGGCDESVATQLARQ